MKVYNGMTASSALIGKYCTTKPSPITSASNNLYVHFHSGSRGYSSYSYYNGVRLEWNVLGKTADKLCMLFGELTKAYTIEHTLLLLTKS